MQHTITPDNIQSFCRTCLNELQQTTMHSIRDMDVQIRAWLQDPTLQSSVAEDVYPLFVCQLCCDQLENFLAFHQMFTRSRKVFQDILEEGLWHNQEDVKPIPLSLATSQMTTPGEEPQDEDPRYKVQAILGGTENDELITPNFCTISPKREDSLDIYDDEFGYAHDDHINNHTDEQESDYIYFPEKINLNASAEKSPSTAKKSKTNKKSKPLNSDGRPQHVCEECGKSYLSSTSLIEHQYSHKSTEEYPFQCSECGKKFRFRRTFKVHQLRHAGIKNYQCPHCDVKKTTQSELLMHINSHTKERQWQCPKCPLVFSRLGNLRRHDQVIHQRIKSFACSHCDKSFYKQEDLKHHEMTHTGEKPHVCSECNKRFILLTSLKNHMKTHNKNVDKKD